MPRLRTRCRLPLRRNVGRGRDRALNAMNQRGPHPWELSFSYGRALQAPALEGVGRRHEQSGRCAKGVLPAGEVQRRSAFRLVRARVGDGRSRLTRSSRFARRALQRGRAVWGLLSHARAVQRGRGAWPSRASPVGPFRGKPAIAQAYAEQPPDDEIVILRARESGEDLVVADYAWRARAGLARGLDDPAPARRRDRPPARHLRLAANLACRSGRPRGLPACRTRGAPRRGAPFRSASA